ncbi:unnamed protein product, partial [Brugia timori]|uniref:DUF1758 domain-containing protein n=1 Tax=Brugia timori TaxID=42155 RepID=A0A0R3QJ11_9BILA
IVEGKTFDHTISKRNCQPFNATIDPFLQRVIRVTDRAAIRTQPQPAVFDLNTNQRTALPDLSKLPIFKINKKTDSCLLFFKTCIRALGDENKIEICGFFDSGSPRTFLTNSASDLINLTRRNPELLQLEGVENQESVPFQSHVVTFQFFVPKREPVLLNASTINKIAWNLPQVDTNLFYVKFPEHRDKRFSVLPREHTIELLIGNDYMWCFIDDTIHLTHPTNLINTSFGWMLAGTHYARWADDNFLPSFFVSPQSVENLWRLEILGIEPINSAVVRDEIHALEIFFKNITIVNKRYQIRWLYRWDKPNLADNFNVAFKRLQGQTKKLVEQVGFYDRYN